MKLVGRAPSGQFAGMLTRSQGAVALLLLLAACDATPRPHGPTVTDSAGVALVAHGHLDYQTLPQWQLSVQPELRVGVVEGDPERQWDQLFAAARRADGSVVALDRGSRQVRAFAADGTHLWSTGGDGDGPGEFRYPWSLSALAGDSIVVSDPGTARLTVLGPDGSLARVAPMPTQNGTSVSWGAMGTSSLLVEVRTAERTEVEN